MNLTSMKLVKLQFSGEKHMATIPSEIVRELELKKGDELLVLREGKRIVLIPQKYVELVVEG